MFVVGTAWHWDYSTEINSTLGFDNTCRGRQQADRGSSSEMTVINTRLWKSIENSRLSIVHTSAIRQQSLIHRSENCSCLILCSLLLVTYFKIIIITGYLYSSKTLKLIYL